MSAIRYEPANSLIVAFLKLADIKRIVFFVKPGAMAMFFPLLKFTTAFPQTGLKDAYAVGYACLELSYIAVSIYGV